MGGQKTEGTNYTTHIVVFLLLTVLCTCLLTYWWTITSMCRTGSIRFTRRSRNRR